MSEQLSTNSVTIRESIRHLDSECSDGRLHNSPMDEATRKSLAERIERLTARYHTCRERARSINSPTSQRRLARIADWLAHARSVVGLPTD